MAYRAGIDKTAIPKPGQLSRGLLICNRNSKTGEFDFKAVPGGQGFDSGYFIQIRFKARREIFLRLAFKGEEHGFRHAGKNKTVFYW